MRMFLSVRRLSWRVLVCVAMLFSLTAHPSYAEPLLQVNGDTGKSEHIPARDLKILLVTGFQLIPCINPLNNGCFEEQHKPWEEWGTFERVWKNPQPGGTFSEDLQSMLDSTGLSSKDFLYYSYTGEWQASSECTDGQQPQNGQCFNYQRPIYQRVHTDIGYLNESAQATYTRRATYLQKVLDAYPDSEFLVIGHSLGGFISTYWAGQADTQILSRVNAVITLDSPLGGHTGICTDVWLWTPQYSTPFLNNSAVQSVIRQAPFNVPLYTFRHFNDTFVPYEQASVAGAWTDTGVSFADSTPCSHGGVKENEIVARLISHVLISGAIGRPNAQKPASAGDHTAPNPLLSSDIYISKPTYYPGFMTPAITLDTLVNGISTTIGFARFNPVVPGMSMNVAPPSQDTAGCFELSISTDGAHIDSTDTSSDSICYSGDGIGASDVALVIDRSCSMGCLPDFDPNKIIQARKSAKLMVDLLESGDQAAVVAFGTSAAIVSPLTSLDAATRQQIKASIDSIQPNGRTSIGDGLLKAVDQLQGSTSGRSKAIVLLSDGLETERPYWNDVRNRVIASGAPVYVVGLGNQGNAQDLDETQLREIASVTGGAYYYSPTAGDLRLIYDTIAGAVTNRETIVQRGDFIAPGGSTTNAVSIDSSIRDVRFVLTWDTNQRNLAFTLQSPSGVVIDTGNAASLGIEAVQEKGYILFKISDPEDGIWTTTVRDLPLRSGRQAVNNENFNLGVSGQSTLSLDLSVGDPLGLLSFRAYDPIPVLATISSKDDIVSATVRGEIRTPSGEVKEFGLFDNGGHSDGAANDGVYGFVVDFASEPGSYTVVLTAEGEISTGERFQRMARESIVLDSNPTPPSDLRSMLVSVPGSPADTPEYCLSYANQGPVTANNVALFVDHPTGELATTSASAIPGLLGYDLGWNLGTLPAGASETILVRGTNIMTNGTGAVFHAAIGSDVDLQSGRSSTPTTIDRNFANNISVVENELDLILSEGWNLVSLPRELTNPEVAAVLCASQGNIELILGFDTEGLTYDPALPEFSTLQEFQEGHAYWIKTSQPSVIRINGDEFYVQKPLFLHQGWNLLSFLPDTTMSVEEALTSLGTNVEVVLGFTNGATSYYPSLPPQLNTLTSLSPMQGYWVKLRKPQVLVYPVPTAASREHVEANQPQSTDGIAATNEWINVYSMASTYNGQPLPFGSTVSALGEDGRLLGQVYVRQDGAYGLLAVYGDDGYTAEVDGARIGESIRFLINGQPATITNGVQPVWSSNGALMQVDLSAAGPVIEQNRLFLPDVAR